MKRYWSGFAVAGMLAATAALGAQSQNPANTPPPDGGARPGTQQTQPAPSAQQRTPNMVTVTGCIQNAPTASAGAPGAAGQAGAPSGQRFMLSDARMAGSEASRGAVGTSGTAATSYQLDGQTADISKHLNHQVEITGTVQSSAASAPGAAAAGGPTLRVSSVKMLSSTCTTSATPGTTGTRPGPNDRPGAPSPGGERPGSDRPGAPEPRPNERP